MPTPLMRFAISLLATVWAGCEFTPPPGNPLEIAFATPSTSVSEADGVVHVKVVASQPAPDDGIAITFTTAGSATVGSDAATPGDYLLAGRTITIPPGASDTDIPLTLTADSEMNEGTESIELTLSEVSLGDLGDQRVHTIAIADLQFPVITFATASSQSTESTPSSVMLALNFPALTASTVDVRVSATSTATTGADATLSALTTVTIPAGATGVALAIGELNDALDEDDPEHFDLALENPQGQLVVGQAAATHRHDITDDDNSPTIGFAVQATSSLESDGEATVVVELSAVSGRPVTVDFATAAITTEPGDFIVDPVPGPLVIPAGARTASIKVMFAADGVDEDDEQFTISLTNPVNAQLGTATTHTHRIVDSDPAPTIAFESAAMTVQEAATDVEVVAKLSAPSERQVSVPFTIGGSATNPDDFTPTASPLVFAPGVISQKITLTIKNDTLNEPAETIALGLVNAVNATIGAPATAVVTITDDNDAPSVVQFDPTETDRQVFEGDSGSQDFTYHLVLDKPSGFTITVPILLSGDALQPSDYSLIGGLPIVIAPGEVVAGITVRVVGETNNQNQGDGGSSDQIVMTIDGATLDHCTLGNVDERRHDIRDDDP